MALVLLDRPSELALSKRPHSRGETGLLRWRSELPTETFERKDDNASDKLNHVSVVISVRGASRNSGFAGKHHKQSGIRVQPSNV